MIRRAFFRRMAHTAMAGMLGAELAWRAPQMGGVLARLRDDLVYVEVTYQADGRWVQRMGGVEVGRGRLDKPLVVLEPFTTWQVIPRP